MTTPRIPPSRTKRFEPRPIRKTETACERQARKIALKAPSEAGSMKMSAGPPTRNVVRRARDSFVRIKLSELTLRRSSLTSFSEIEMEEAVVLIQGAISKELD